MLLIHFALIVSNTLVRKKERKMEGRKEKKKKERGRTRERKKERKEARKEGRKSVFFPDSCEFQMMLNFSQRWCVGRMDF